MNTHALAAAIAAALGADWTHAVNSEETFATVTRQPDGLALMLRGDTYRQRLSISTDTVWGDNTDHGDRTYYGTPAPSITVAATRSADAIARDIRSRLLPDAETWYAAALSWREAERTRRAQQRQMKQRLLAMPGASQHAWSIEDRVYGPGWESRIESGQNVLLTFRSIPIDVALTILRAFDAATQPEIWSYLISPVTINGGGEDQPCNSTQ